MEGLHLVVGVEVSREGASLPNVLWLSAVVGVMLISHHWRVGLALTSISIRNHQSLRSRFICKETVVPTDGAKRMVLLLLILDWSLLESLGRIDIQPAQKGWFGGGMPATSPMAKSVSFSRKGKKSIVDGFVIAYLSLVELFCIYHG